MTSLNERRMMNAYKLYFVCFQKWFRCQKRKSAALLNFGGQSALTTLNILQIFRYKKTLAGWYEFLNFLWFSAMQNLNCEVIHLLLQTLDAVGHAAFGYDFNCIAKESEMSKVWDDLLHLSMDVHPLYVVACGDKFRLKNAFHYFETICFLIGFSLFQFKFPQIYSFLGIRANSSKLEVLVALVKITSTN